MTETLILQQIREALGSRPDVRIWRNNSGALKDFTGRLIHFGVAAPGGSDLIGWVKVDGRAIFLAIEVKVKTGRVTQAQVDFINFVRQHGGRAGIARTVQDAEEICYGAIRD